MTTESATPEGVASKRAGIANSSAGLAGRASEVLEAARLLFGDSAVDAVLAKYKEPLARDVDALGFAPRTVNVLRANGIRTLDELVQRSSADLLELPDIGRVSLNDIRDHLALEGRTLRFDVSRA